MTTILNTRTVLVTLLAAWIMSVIAVLAFAAPARASDGRPTVVVTVDRTALGVCEESSGWDVYVHANGRPHLMVGSSHEIVSPTGHFGPVSVSARCGERTESVTADMTFLNL